MTDTTSRRPLLAAAVGTAVLALLAVPLLWTTVFAVAGFTGCFLGCREPEPAVGVLWGTIAWLCACAPVAAAALAGGYRLRAALPVIGLLAVVLVLVLVVGHGVIAADAVATGRAG